MSKYPKPTKRRKKPIKITKIIRDSVLTRDDNKCRLCDDVAVDLHHLLFKSLGGNNSSYNLIPLCRAHHELAHKYQHKYFNILFITQLTHYPQLTKGDLKK